MKKRIKEIESNDSSTIQATVNVYLDSAIQWRDALRADQACAQAWSAPLLKA